MLHVKKSLPFIYVYYFYCVYVCFSRNITSVVFVSVFKFYNFCCNLKMIMIDFCDFMCKIDIVKLI